MKKLFNLLTSGRFLLVVIFLSLALIALGFWMINSQKERQTPHNETSQAMMDAQEIPLPPLPAIDNEGPADLARLQSALQSMSEGIIPVNHGLSKEDIAQAIAEATPGSEAWCDLLLLADDQDWTEDQTTVFAESCI